MGTPIKLYYLFIGFAQKCSKHSQGHHLESLRLGKRRQTCAPLRRVNLYLVFIHSQSYCTSDVPGMPQLHLLSRHNTWHLFPLSNCPCQDGKLYPAFLACCIGWHLQSAKLLHWKLGNLGPNNSPINSYLKLESPDIFKGCCFFFFFFFFLATPRHMKFPSQRSDLSHSCNLSRNCGSRSSGCAWPGIRSRGLCLASN